MSYSGIQSIIADRSSDSNVGEKAIEKTEAFMGGFLHGIFTYPKNVGEGIIGQTPQGAADFSEILEITNKVIRTPTKDEIQKIGEVWTNVPAPIKEEMNLGMIRFGGGITAGVAVSTMLSSMLGRAAGFYAGQQLGAMHIVPARTAAGIVVGGMLSYFSFVGNTKKFTEASEPLYQRCPQLREIVQETRQRVSAENKQASNRQ